MENIQEFNPFIGEPPEGDAEAASEGGNAEEIARLEEALAEIMDALKRDPALFERVKENYIRNAEAGGDGEGEEA